MTQPSDILTDYIAPGDVFGGRYEVEREIDAGSYGAIYLATDRSGGERVAVKALPPRGKGSSEKAVGRFERELKVVRNLDHSSIVQVVDYGETDEAVLYMVMEYIRGRTLDERVARQGPMELEDALTVAEQIAAALGVAHASGVIHRDLKPANIMLIDDVDEESYRVKILDFGMAKLFAQLGGESIVALTRDGVAVGTPRYIAPEQARGSEQIGPWTDLYALGLLLYEMVVGRKAVPYDQVDDAVAEHVSSEPLALPGLGDAPRPIRELVRALTEKDLERRLQSAEESVRRIRAIEARELSSSMAQERDSGYPGPNHAGSGVEPTGGDGTRPIYGSVGPAPEGPETRSRSELRETDDGDSLELDWESHRRGQRRPRRRGMPGRLARLPRGARLALGLMVTLLTTLLAFMALTAQFHEFTGLRRAFFGLAPLLVACFTVMGSPRSLRTWHFFRNVAGFNVLGFLIAHVVGPLRLAGALSRDPGWFLHSLRTEPIVGSLYETLVWVGHRYADLLFAIFG